jgi:hypothetical protein
MVKPCFFRLIIIIAIYYFFLDHSDTYAWRGRVLQLPSSQCQSDNAVIVVAFGRSILHISRTRTSLFISVDF